jgi:X-Pro dipeptidyl-peptidase
VILTYSPYNTLSETTTPNLANDDLGQRYVPRGYARAVADVLGTRNSSGCWDYGGADEQQSGVDLVNFLTAQPWSNGRVAMIGGSYDGTTATMVAARGEDVPGLVAIVPIAGISRWYGYAYWRRRPLLPELGAPERRGHRHAARVRLRPRSDAADRPDRPAVRRQAREPREPVRVGPAHDPGLRPAAGLRLVLARARLPQGRREHPRRGPRAHGWQDYNVKQEEGVDLYRALTNAPFKRLYMWQAGHSTPGAPNWQPLLDRFFDHTLLGVDNGVDSEPPVITEGRSATSTSTGFRTEAAWAAAGHAGDDDQAHRRLLHGHGGHDGGAVDPGCRRAEASWLFSTGQPLANRHSNDRVGKAPPHAVGEPGSRSSDAPAGGCGARWNDEDRFPVVS